MLNIAICDDSKEITDKIKDIIFNWSVKENLDVSVEKFNEGNTLINSIENGNYYDLIFLDIVIPDLSGIDAAKLIRENELSQDSQIIFISGQSSYAMELFQVQPMNFLIKPFDDNVIVQMMEFAYKTITGKKKAFSYESGKNIHHEPLSNIVYFESSGRIITIHTKHGDDTFYGKLADVAEKLKDKGFLYIHKSYLVNYELISFFKKDEVVLVNNIVLPISRNNKKEVAIACKKMYF